MLELCHRIKCRRRNENRALIILILIVAVVLCGYSYSDKKVEKKMVTVIHIVSKGETLWSIGEKYITPDRYMPEFIEGIYELNYDRVFMKREQEGFTRKSVYPGDHLEIRYWQDQEIAANGVL